VAETDADRLAFCGAAPSVRFIAFATSATGDLAFVRA
jgi:hypothetical protein